MIFSSSFCSKKYEQDSIPRISRQDDGSAREVNFMPGLTRYLILTRFRHAGLDPVSHNTEGINSVLLEKNRT